MPRIVALVAATTLVSGAFPQPASALPVFQESQQDAVGEWRLEVDWPSGTLPVTLTVTETEEGLAATWSGPRGEVAAESVAFDAGALTMVIPVTDQNGTRLDLRLRAEIDGDRLEGALTMPRGRQIPVRGERERAGRRRVRVDSGLQVPIRALAAVLYKTRGDRAR